MGLVKRVIADARPLVLGCGLILFGFSWLFTVLIGVIDLSALVEFTGTLPAFIKRLSIIPLAQLAVPRGMLAMFFVHPVVLGVGSAWCIARGSDAVSGELERGSLELVLAHPVGRWKYLAVHAVTTTGGSALIALALWLGLGAGLATSRLENAPTWRELAPAVLNFLALLFCVASVVTLLSACDRYRWRTIGIAGGFVLIEFILKVVVRMWPNGKPLTYVTVFGAYEPHMLVQYPDQAWGLILKYATILVVVGAASLSAALLVFEKRDLPAPL